MWTTITIADGQTDYCSVAHARGVHIQILVKTCMHALHTEINTITAKVWGVFWCTCINYTIDTIKGDCKICKKKSNPLLSMIWLHIGAFISRNSNTRVIIASTSVNEPMVNCEIVLTADVILAHAHALQWYCVRRRTVLTIKLKYFRAAPCMPMQYWSVNNGVRPEGKKGRAKKKIAWYWVERKWAKEGKAKISFMNWKWWRGIGQTIVSQSTTLDIIQMMMNGTVESDVKIVYPVQGKLWSEFCVRGLNSIHPGDIVYSISPWNAILVVLCQIILPHTNSRVLLSKDTSFILAIIHTIVLLPLSLTV